MLARHNLQGQPLGTPNFIFRGKAEKLLTFLVSDGIISKFLEQNF